MSQTKRISRPILVIIIVVIIIMATGIGAYQYLNQSSAPTHTQSTMTTQSILVIDDALWPNYNVNMLYELFSSPWPNWMEYTVYQPLVDVDLAAEYNNGVIQYLPGLAQNWQTSPDGTTWTFNLRQNVTFSNGDPFNAYQMWVQLYGFYYLSANSTSWYQEVFPLFDMSKVTFGPATLAMLGRTSLSNPSPEALSLMTNQTWPIYTTGPYQLVFHLKSPFNWFLGTMVSSETLVLDSQYILNNGGFGTPASINSYFNQNAIPGTGPYRITEVSLNAFVKFAQNPSYWGSSLTQNEISQNPMLDPGHVATVVEYYKPDDVARYADLDTGTAQIVAIESSNWNMVTSNPSKYAYLRLPNETALFTGLALNTAIYPTNITDVRRAIVHAINYTDVSEKAFHGEMTPFVGPGTPIWKDFYDLGGFEPYSYNLTLAQQYLAKANIQNMPTFSFKVASGCQYCINAAQVIQGDLANIGITVSVQVLMPSAYWANYGSMAYNTQNAAQIGQLALVGVDWAPITLAEPEYWFSFVNANTGWGNWAIYSNPTVQAAVDSFTSSTDVSSIQSQVAKAQAQIYNDAPYAWLGLNRLWYGDGSLVWQKSVISGFYVEPMWSGQDTSPLFNTVTFQPAQ